MTDLTNNVRLEVQTAANDVFVWGVSTWSGYRWGGPSDTAESGIEWMNILGPSHDIKVSRGAKRDGLTLALEAGTLEATVYDSEVDPNTNPYIKPGTPMRLVYNGGLGDVSVFNGVIRQVQVTYRGSKPQVRLSAVDRVKDLANTNRSGVVSGTFAERVSDLLDKHGIPNAAIGSSGLVLAQNAYDSTLLNHLQLAATSERGRFFVDKDNVVRAFGRDIIDVGWNAGNLLANPSLYDTNADGVAEGWTVYNKNTSSGVSRTVVDGTQNLAASSIPDTNRVGVRLVVPAIKNQAYTFSLDYTVSGTNTALRVYVDGYNNTTASYVGNVNATYSTGSGRAVINYPANANIEVLQIYVWLESNAGTTGTSAAGSFTRPFLEYGTTDGSHPVGPKVYFTDQPAVGESDVEYVDIAVAYDSAALVNDVYVNNLTHGYNEDMEPISVNTKYGPYRNVTSIATFGAFTEEVETNLSTELDVEDFANAVLAANQRPELRVDSVRFNASNQPEKAASLDVFDTVNVEYSNEAFHIGEDFNVLFLEHTITASPREHRWMVDVGLISNEEVN